MSAAAPAEDSSSAPLTSLGHAYRLATAPETAAASAAGAFAGSALDAQDGFIHLSLAADVPGTAARYYADAQPGGLALLRVDLDAVAAASGLDVRFELAPSRAGSLFPHVYGGAIPWAAVDRVLFPARGADGAWQWPADVATAGDRELLLAETARRRAAYAALVSEQNAALAAFNERVRAYEPLPAAAAAAAAARAAAASPAASTAGAMPALAPPPPARPPSTTAPAGTAAATRPVEGSYHVRCSVAPSSESSSEPPAPAAAPSATSAAAEAARAGGARAPSTTHPRARSAPSTSAGKKGSSARHAPASAPPAAEHAVPRSETPPFVPRGTRRGEQQSSDVMSTGGPAERMPSSDASVSPAAHAKAPSTKSVAAERAASGGDGHGGAAAAAAATTTHAPSSRPRVESR